METVRRVAVWLAALNWVGALGLHVVAAAGGVGLIPQSTLFTLAFYLTIGVAAVVLNVTKPTGDPNNSPAPRWYVVALAVVALVTGGWSMVVGSGVPNTGFNPFVDTGVPAGEQGDRYLHSHGRRVRALTEEEFQRVQAWHTVGWTGVMAGFAGMTLAGALYFQQVRRALNQALQQTAAAGSVSGTS